MEKFVWGWEGRQAVGTRAPPHSGTSGSFNSRTIQGARLWAVSCDQHITAIVHRGSPKTRGVCAWLTDRVKSELCIACTGSWWCAWGSPPGLSGAPTVYHTVSKDMQLLCVFASPLTVEVLNNGACSGPRTPVFSDLLWGRGGGDAEKPDLVEGKWNQASSCFQASKKKQKPLPTSMAFPPIAHLLGSVVSEDKGREARPALHLPGPSPHPPSFPPLSLSPPCP